MSEYSRVIGIDLGDKSSVYVVLGQRNGDVISEGKLRTTRDALTETFAGWEPARFVIEACGQSAWISDHLGQMGHEVLVANPRRLRCIYDAHDKSDERDANMLARIGRMDPELLYPIQHRGRESRKHLAVLKARDCAVATRTRLINCVRSTVKSFGERLETCSADSFHKIAKESVPHELRAALSPLVQLIETLTKSIRSYDKKIGMLCQHYQETELLRGVPGVGPITALTYLLTLEYSDRFEESRKVPAFFGLTPRRDQSGESDKQLRITKAGDGFVRRLLVGSAQHILRKNGSDTALRRWGLRLAERGGKNGKKRAVIAVARKLAVLLHRLWATGSCYEPFPAGVPEACTQDSPTETGPPVPLSPSVVGHK